MPQIRLMVFVRQGGRFRAAFALTPRLCRGRVPPVRHEPEAGFSYPACLGFQVAQSVGLSGAPSVTVSAVEDLAGMIPMR